MVSKNTCIEYKFFNNRDAASFTAAADYVLEQLHSANESFCVCRNGLEVKFCFAKPRTVVTSAIWRKLGRRYNHFLLDDYVQVYDEELDEWHKA